MKAHQSRMDVIGNNIANVNTVGFKGSRATFRDVYYQTMQGASGASASAGGMNASQIGYGSQLGAIDLMMTRSSFQMTDNAMDLAIDGEGFFQVQDADGNIFYTRAGMTRFDSAGNLVDAMGNFVLGVSGNPIGKASSSEKIQIQVPPVEPSAAKVIETINGVKITIEASNNTKDGNVGFTFVSGAADGSVMNDDTLATAEVGTAGIVIRLNPKKSFASASALESAVNDAINKYMQETNGKDHPAGKFKISVDPASKFPAGGLTGEEICSTDYTVQKGKISNWPADSAIKDPTNQFLTMFKPTGESGSAFGGGGVTDFEAAFTPGVAPARGTWKITATIGGRAYTGEISEDEKDSGKFNLKNGTGEDWIEFERPSFTALNDKATGGSTGADPGALTLKVADNAGGSTNTDLTTLRLAIASKSEPSKALGFSSKKIVLKGGTEGGPQGLENLSGISVGADGVIVAQHPVHGDIVVGRVDLVTFANPQGLIAAGNSYFTTSANVGKMTRSQPGTNGAGALASGSLESSNVDLSREFSDMIVTERGFQANSRLITVSDEMLNELVNLKR